jgi:steroid delta-isomerase-like uncharacterized protein
MLHMSAAQQTPPSWVQQYLDAWNTHDGAAVVAFMTVDVVYTDLALDEHLEGRDAVVEFINNLSVSASTNYSFTLGQVITSDDSYGFEWTMSGTNDRANSKRGFPNTGRRFELSGVSIGRLRNGKIAENKSYWSLTAYLRQLGFMPAQPGATKS